MRRERLLFAGLAVLLVLLRVVVPVAYEGFYFDSDQAIVGLMAKHLASFQRFPLYYYGLNYLLGVQAWIIAPFFWVFRPSVAVMRLPLVLLNAGVAVALVATLSRQLAIRPALAFVAALPFVAAAPPVAGHLLETAGASIEPFAYILALWFLRRRPFAFGVLLAIGFLHREFTIYAVPAIFLVELATGELWGGQATTVRSAVESSIRRGARAVAGFGIVWLIVDDLKLHLSGGSVALQAASLKGQMCFDGASVANHTRGLLTEAIPIAFGGLPVRLAGFRMDTDLISGSRIAGWIAAATMTLMAVRLIAASTRARGFAKPVGFAAYLGLVGLFAACAYPLSCNTGAGGPPLLRYLLLILFLPIGIAAAFFARESSIAVRRAAAAGMVLWAASNVVDNAQLIRSTIATPPLNERRVLSDYLVAHRIRYARAIYWDAYVVDFLSRERVVTASLDLIRIPEYQEDVDRHADAAVTLVRLPCEGGEHVASWCVQR